MRTVLGLLALLGILVRSGFCLSGAYWTWRMATALGPHRPGRLEQARAILNYARWVDRMRSISR